jgi:uncharacterized protein (TIGR02246 family)
MRILLILAILSGIGRADVPGSSEDETAIRKLETAWQAGWNSHDMKALTALLSDDIDFVSVAGNWMKGKEAFEKHHAERHAMQFKDSVWTTSDVKVAFLKPDVALVHVKWALKGDRNPDGSPRQPRTGIFTRVVTKHGGRWLIRASHNVNIGLPIR